LIKVLLVDDNIERVKRVSGAVSRMESSEFVQLDAVDTSDSARIKLSADYDLMILDVVIPKKRLGVASAKEGLLFLNDICNIRKNYLRPGLIIGLTANIEEIGVYQTEFNKKVSVVLKGDSMSEDWLSTLIETVSSLVEAEKRTRAIHTKKRLITVHGIRTYGSWQRTLKESMSDYSSEFEFFELKYGFFDLFSFSMPYFRKRKAKEIGGHLRALLDDGGSSDTYVVGHSFGTLIISEAFKEYSGKNAKAVILCGSPISNKVDISHIVSSSELTINECATKDNVLVIARALLLGLGDSGRTGFIRDNSPNFKNRFFKGGHSLYFEKYNGDYFYSKYWVPTLCADKPPEDADDRENYVFQDFVEFLIRVSGVLKPVVYLVVASIILLSLISY